MGEKEKKGKAKLAYQKRLDTIRHAKENKAATKIQHAWKVRNARKNIHKFTLRILTSEECEWSYTLDHHKDRVLERHFAYRHRSRQRVQHAYLYRVFLCLG